MAVLIITERDDIHGDALLWALKQAGAEGDRWSTGEFPEHQRSSIRICADPRPPACAIDGVRFEKYQSIWLRRVARTHAISSELAPSDREMAQLQAERYSAAIRSLFSPQSAWINPPEKRSLANIKPLQLLAAREAGFQIPDTLLSNDPSAISDFFSQHDGNVIYKGFTPAFWEDANSKTTTCLFTSKLSKELIQDDVSITSCPGIYQRYVPKSADIRVTFFGGTYCAAKIHSQTTQSGAIDFRSDLKGEAPMEILELDSAFLEKCKKLSANLGLLHGSYDFVETVDGELTFLEINEMGQFLWLEERLPDLRLLAIFSAFSLDPRPDFVYVPAGGRTPTFSSFLETDEYRAFRQTLSANGTSLPFHWTE